MSYRMQDKMSDRMSEYLSGLMSEYMPGKASEYMSQGIAGTKVSTITIPVRSHLQQGFIMEVPVDRGVHPL